MNLATTIGVAEETRVRSDVDRESGKPDEERSSRAWGEFIAMHMGMTPDMDIEVAVLQAQRDIMELRGDLEELGKFIKGNGDPTKGLLWLVADLGRMSLAQTTMIEAYRRNFENHVVEGHAARQRGFWGQMALDAVRQASVNVSLVILFLLAIGFLDYVRSGRTP